MVNDLDVAQVLEDAATLYEDEKIEWCQGAWYRQPGCFGPLTMCAEGALMAAAGFAPIVVKTFQDGNQSEQILANASTGREAYSKLLGARKAVTDALPPVASGKQGIPYWNDRLTGGFEDAAGNAKAKQAVIDMFRTVAKDLRNQAPAEEL